MYGFIYETTNNINGKKYIGKKVYNSHNQWKTYLGSGELLKKAIEKYGKDNFSRKILFECSTSEELCIKEKELIQFYNAINDESYYNLAEGGTGGVTTKSGKNHPKSNKKLAIGYDIQNNIEYHFYCIKTAASYLKLNEKQIADCLRGDQVTVKNILFYYEGIVPKIPNRSRVKIAKYKGSEIEFISNVAFAKEYNLDPRRVGEVVNGKRKSLDDLEIVFKDNSEPRIVLIDIND